MVAVRAPLEGLYDKPVSVSAPCVPVAPSTNTGYTVSSVLLLAVTVTLVANAAVPDVSWLPDEFTPGNVMLAVPSKDTPPISLAVANAVAVAALPVHDPDEPDALPVTLPTTPPLAVIAASNCAASETVNPSKVVAPSTSNAPLTSNEVSVPTLVIAVCAAVVSVTSAT